MAVPPEKVAEAERASTLFHVALVQIGSKAIEDSLALWEDVPPVPGASSAQATQRWLATAVRYTMQRRLRARDLALAYYRYQRALLTGRTVAIPGQENPPYMTLPELRREFEAYLNPEAPEEPIEDEPPVDREVPVWARSTPAAAGETQEDSEAADGDPEQPDEASDEDDELDRILVEEIEGLEAELDAIEQQAEAEIEANLQVLGPINQERKFRKIDSDDIDTVDAERQQAHAEAGRRQAAATERVVMNGARGPKYHVASRDPRVIGYVRVSRTGTPCGWCAMLISRGFTEKSGLYRSERSAQHQGRDQEQDMYHDNCKCDVVPIYDLAQLEGSSQFALNRYYAELWPRVTKGLGGDAALSAWRRFIRQEAKSQESQEAAA